MPGAHPTARRDAGQLPTGHFCAQTTGAKSLDIFLSSLISGSAVRHFFPGILSLSLPGWLAELFSLLPALTFLRARPGAAGSRCRGGGGWQGPPLRGSGCWTCTAREAAPSWRSASTG